MEWFKALDAFEPDPREKDTAESPTPGTSTKVQRRQAPVQDELDLHGLKGRDAEAALKVFLDSARKRGLKKVRIVHGRGLHSSGEPVLKDLSRDWASRQKGVKWEPCAPAEGGPGAFWIWIGP